MAPRPATRVSRRPATSTRLPAPAALGREPTQVSTLLSRAAAEEPVLVPFVCGGLRQSPDALPAALTELYTVPHLRDFKILQA